jgi:hypothetical protein
MRLRKLEGYIEKVRKRVDFEKVRNGVVNCEWVWGSEIEIERVRKRLRMSLRECLMSLREWERHWECEIDIKHDFEKVTKSLRKWERLTETQLRGEVKHWEKDCGEGGGVALNKGEGGKSKRRSINTFRVL